MGLLCKRWLEMQFRIRALDRAKETIRRTRDPLRETLQTLECSARSDASSAGHASGAEAPASSPLHGHGHAHTVASIPSARSREYLDSLFSPLYVAELTAGGTGHEAHHRRLLFLQSLQASAVRATAHMAVTLTLPAYNNCNTRCYTPWRV